MLFHSFNFITIFGFKTVLSRALYFVYFREVLQRSVKDPVSCNSLAWSPPTEPIFTKSTIIFIIMFFISLLFFYRYLSQRSYSYVKDTLNYPLPGLSTLRKWASLSQLKSGVLDDVFRIMQISGQNKSAAQRCTVLSFSEMKVASVYEYNDKEDDIIGPHNYMQVSMLYFILKRAILIGDPY